MAVDSDSNASEKREGRGRRWLIRLLVLFAVALILLLAWNALERQGLARRFAALRATGEPAEPADLISPAVADASNAVIELRAAARIIDPGATTWKAADEMYSLRLPFSEKDIVTIRNAVAPNAAAFPLVETAVQKSGVDWGLAFQSPIALMLLPDLNEQRQLANLLRYEALIAHQQGDDATAVRRVGQMLFMSRAMQRQPLFLPQLVGMGISAIACDLAADIAPDLRIDTDSRSASEAQVREIIGQLLDESATREGMMHGLAGERVTSADTLTAIAEGRVRRQMLLPNFGPIMYLKPLIYRNASGSIDHMNAAIAVARETTNWPAFRDRFAATSTPLKTSPRMHMIAGIISPSIERTFEQYYRSAANRRMTATTLAVASYRAKNGGNFPPTLDALVPEFLPAVPLDPLAGPGKTLGYVNDPIRPRIYSVGTNGVDNGGTPVDDAKSRAENERLSDDVTDLVRQPKPPEPESDAD